MNDVMNMKTEAAKNDICSLGRHTAYPIFGWTWEWSSTKRLDWAHCKLLNYACKIL